MRFRAALLSLCLLTAAAARADDPQPADPCGEGYDLVCHADETCACEPIPASVCGEGFVLECGRDQSCECAPLLGP